MLKKDIKCFQYKISGFKKFLLFEYRYYKIEKYLIFRDFISALL
jgi:hypothetical protein